MKKVAVADKPKIETNNTNIVKEKPIISSSTSVQTDRANNEPQQLESVKTELATDWKQPLKDHELKEEATIKGKLKFKLLLFE